MATGAEGALPESELQPTAIAVATTPAAATPASAQLDRLLMLDHPARAAAWRPVDAFSCRYVRIGASRRSEFLLLRSAPAAKITAVSEVPIAKVERVDGALEALASSWAVVLERCFDEERCVRWVDGTYAAREVWTSDFGGEQYCLGRAFYTHLEEGKSAAYFANATASDALVEAHVPGLQAAMIELAARVVGGKVVRRRGWCGPGVHVFPPSGPVAARGGVRHFDTEGLAGRHIERGLPAITLVAMLQATETDGGLRVWDVRYEGRDHPTADEIASPNTVVSSRTGDVVVIDSYRLHQIQPFGGSRERISATVHAARVDADVWASWF